MILKSEIKGNQTDSLVDDNIIRWIEAFLIDRKARGCAKGTMVFYRQKLKYFADYCESQSVSKISQITPNMFRLYLLYLEDTGHNPGGRHAVYRVLRAFLFWFEDEMEPENWSNPVLKVKAPKVPLEPLEPVDFETVSQMIKACEANTFCGIRDKALLLFLLDTGVRAGELLAINIEDINQARGDILIRHSKGKRPRYVFMSKHTKRALRKYLNQRKDDNKALWVTHPRFNSGRLKYDSLRAIMTRRAKQAGIDPPSLHDFRRAFALAMLRNGTDIFTLAKLMGHKGITVLQRYLRETRQDTKIAHRRASPVETGLFKSNQLVNRDPVLH